MKVTYNLSELFPILAARHRVLPNQVEIVGATAPLTPAVPTAPVLPKSNVSVEHFRVLRDFLLDNNKIGAIKYFKSEICPGAGLKEAKDIVEFLCEKRFDKF